MAKGLGRMDRGFGLGSVKRSLPPKAAGLYPTKGKGLGEYGTVKFPSILEAYNRDSDFKRWKLGMDYYFGSGRTWGDYQILSLARFLPGAVSGISRDIVTLFPSKTSPEKAWYTGIRTRGSIILPQPIQSSDLTLNTSPADEADHTLTYDVSGILTSTQVAVFGNFIGDQFEDTASGTSYPDDIISKPAGSIALTLIAVSPGAMTLTFALSKAYTRIEKNGRIYWDKVKYDRDDPAIWNTSGSRHLCSSHKFFAAALTTWAVPSQTSISQMARLTRLTLSPCRTPTGRSTLLGNEKALVTTGNGALCRSELKSARSASISMHCGGSAASPGMSQVITRR